MNKNEIGMGTSLAAMRAVHRCLRRQRLTETQSQDSRSQVPGGKGFRTALPGKDKPEATEDLAARADGSDYRKTDR